MQNKNLVGFTLIEMLVVVLIMGILASIALPQYQKAVAKARWVEMIMMADAIYDAQEAYWLQYRKYTPNFADLSIKFPLTESSGSQGDAGLRLKNGGYVALMDFDEGWSQENGCQGGSGCTGAYIMAVNTKVPANYLRIPAHTKGMGGNWQKYRGARICSPGRDIERGKSFCKSLGGQEISDFNQANAGGKKHYLL